MKQFRKYAEGGPIDEMDMDAPPSRDPNGINAPNDVKDISFKEAFSRARSAGLKSFVFKGKKFSTALAASTSAKSASDAAVKRAEGKEAGSKSRFMRDMASSPSGKTVTDNPRDPGYFQGRVNPKTLLPEQSAMKCGGKVKAYAKGGSVTRGDGCAQRGHTKGKNR
jgi:hypothetical protein